MRRRKPWQPGLNTFLANSTKIGPGSLRRCCRGFSNCQFKLTWFRGVLQLSIHISIYQAPRETDATGWSPRDIVTSCFHHGPSRAPPSGDHPIYIFIDHPEIVKLMVITRNLLHKVTTRTTRNQNDSSLNTKTCISAEHQLELQLEERKRNPENQTRRPDSCLHAKTVAARLEHFSCKFS